MCVSLAVPQEEEERGGVRRGVEGAHDRYREPPSGVRAQPAVSLPLGCLNTTGNRRFRRELLAKALSRRHSTVTPFCPNCSVPGVGGLLNCSLKSPPGMLA